MHRVKNNIPTEYVQRQKNCNFDKCILKFRWDYHQTIMATFSFYNYHHIHRKKKQLNILAVIEIHRHINNNAMNLLNEQTN